jgi:hypothetical protein
MHQISKRTSGVPGTAAELALRPPRCACARRRSMKIETGNAREIGIVTGEVLREESARFPEFAGEGATSAAHVEGRARRPGFDDLDMAPRYDTAFSIHPIGIGRQLRRWHNVPETREIFRRFAMFSHFARSSTMRNRH